MRTLNLVAAVAVLAGLGACRSTQELAAHDDATCQSYGAPAGSDAYVQCRMLQSQLRASQQQATSAALMSAETALMQQPQPRMPLQCTTSPWMGRLETTCH